MKTVEMAILDRRSREEFRNERSRSEPQPAEQPFPMRMSSLVAVGALLLLVGGCGGGKLGSFDSPDSAGSNKLAELLGLSKDQGAPSADAQGRRVFCPEIVVLEGTGVARLYAGGPPSSTSLRVQYSIEDTARECSVQGDKLALKIGIAGKVLLGPAGSPGTFTVPVRIAIVRAGDGAGPVVSKLYRAAATIPAQRTEESFTIISEPISVPFVHEHAEEDYTIKVGIDSAGGSEAGEGERRRQ